MTQNQIGYWNLQNAEFNAAENQRHNYATEALTGQNIDVSRGNLAELGRHNLATEGLAAVGNSNDLLKIRNDYALGVRSNEIAAQNAKSNAISAIANRLNANTNEWNARTNAYSATIDARNASTNAANAATNARNADTNVINSQIARDRVTNDYILGDIANYNQSRQAAASQQNADANTRNAASNAQNANTNRGTAISSETRGWVHEIGHTMKNILGIAAMLR